jgi:hypothetical protein
VTGTRVVFVPAYGGGHAGEVVLTLEIEGEVAENACVLDLLGRRQHGSADGALVDSVREFCRKRGIRFEPGPWRYGGGLV